MTVAVRRGRWRLAAPEPVHAPETLLTRLIERAGGGAVALGADLPIGVPRAYAALRPEADFPAFLRSLPALPDFFHVCPTVDDVRVDRPFYPARGVKGMTRLSHAQALGVGEASALSRWCDRATPDRPAGAPLFWTLGANQSGKAAISAWQSLILPALGVGTVLPAPPSGRLRLWPFEGGFRALLAPGRVVLAETYPAEALRHLGLRLAGSKRRQADRRALAPALLGAVESLGLVMDDGFRAAVLDGFGADAAGEDRFDSVLGVLAVVNVLDGNRPDTAPADVWIQRWEGWVLGQTALPL